MHPQFETFKKLEFNMVDRMYRDSSGSSMPGVANPSGLFPNLSLSLDGVMSNPGLPNASSSMLPFPYCNLQELISGTKQLQNVNQDFSVGTFDAITHAAMMADLNQKISEVERKLLLPTRTHPDQTTLNLESRALDRDMDSRFRLEKGELSKLLSMHSKHPLSSSCTEPAFKRTRTGEYSKIDSIDVGVVVPLSTSELKATFPLPPLKSNVRRPPRVKLSSTLKEVWEKFEKMSDAMDDTASDQEAFVKKLFVRSLHRSGLSHLTERIQKSKSNAVCDGGRKK
jgi:hypothetical protein